MPKLADDCVWKDLQHMEGNVLIERGRWGTSATYHEVMNLIYPYEVRRGGRFCENSFLLPNSEFRTHLDPSPSTTVIKAHHWSIFAVYGNLNMPHRRFAQLTYEQVTPDEPGTAQFVWILPFCSTSRMEAPLTPLVVPPATYEEPVNDTLPKFANGTRALPDSKSCELQSAPCQHPFAFV